MKHTTSPKTAPSHLKTHQIAGYYPHFWIKNVLFSYALSCTGLMRGLKGTQKTI